MDTKKCIVLLSVLDKLNITEAAKSLGYTPSGVSRIIESIEKELGFSLLIRSHDGVLPTTECSLLLPLFRELASLDKAFVDLNINQGKILFEILNRMKKFWYIRGIGISNAYFAVFHSGNVLSGLH